MKLNAMAMIAFNPALWSDRQPPLCRRVLFGAFSHRLLLGNFGDGIINAFNAFSGKFEGSLLDAKNKPL